MRRSTSIRGLRVALGVGASLGVGVSLGCTDLAVPEAHDNSAGNVGCERTNEARFESGAVRVHDVQGPAHVAALVNSFVNDVRGVVTRVEAAGFYLQDPEPDSDPRTSEALFVRSEHSEVAVGEHVSVAGVVEEHRGRCEACSVDEQSLSQTELVSQELIVLGRATDLPLEQVLGGEGLRARELIENDADGDVERLAVRFDPDRDALDLYESLEGMRVLVQRPRVVGPSRSGHEFWVVPESSTVATTQRGGLSGADESANAARICVRSDEEVALDVGNRFDEDLQGVFGGHGPCLQVQRVPAASSTLERQQLPWSAPRANELSLATLNVHNLSIATGGERFNRLARDFRNVLGLPDVVLLNEIQDDSADTDDGVVSAEQTLTGLSDAVEQQSHVRYAWAEIDPVDGQDGGQPGANIRQVFFYRSDRGLQLAATDGGLAAYLPTNPVRLKPSDPAFVASRKPLVVAFTFGATRLVLLGNHFVSKTIDEPDWGRQQPPRHPSETQRIAQAQVLATFVEQLLSAAPEACVVVLGDMNDTHDSAALAPLRDIGFRSLFETLPATERYSYVFEGNSEALDHLFVDAAGAALVTQFAAVHSHAEFAQADSDHDPLVARLRLPLP